MSASYKKFEQIEIFNFVFIPKFLFYFTVARIIVWSHVDFVNYPNYKEMSTKKFLSFKTINKKEQT